MWSDAKAHAHLVGSSQVLTMHQSLSIMRTGITSTFSMHDELPSDQILTSLLLWRWGPAKDSVTFSSLPTPFPSNPAAAYHFRCTVLTAYLALVTDPSFKPAFLLFLHRIDVIMRQKNFYDYTAWGRVITTRLASVMDRLYLREAPGTLFAAIFTISAADPHVRELLDWRVSAASAAPSPRSTGNPRPPAAAANPRAPSPAPPALSATPSLPCFRWAANDSCTLPNCSHPHTYGATEPAANKTAFGRWALAHRVRRV
jgi:hypothetical protein